LGNIILLDPLFDAMILQSVPGWYARLLRLGGYWGMIVRRLLLVVMGWLGHGRTTDS
jgi:hypothetical protein